MRILFVLLSLLLGIVISKELRAGMELCQIEKIASSAAEEWSYPVKNANLTISRDKNTKYLESMYGPLMRHDDLRKLMVKPGIVMVIYSPIQTPQGIIEDGGFYVFIHEKTSKVVAVFNGKLLPMKIEATQ